MTGKEAVVLAIDIGGTSLKGALVDGTGAIRGEQAVILEGRTGEAALACLEDLGAGLMGMAASGGLRPLAAGVIAPGVDEASGRVLFAANLGWRDLALRDRMAGHLGLPVATGHDVRTAGLAENLLGGTDDRRDFAYVMIGTGIAAALLCNGAIVSGARNMGGEFGHMPVIPDGEPCGCGQLGCLEAYASAAAIARRYRARGGAAGRSARDIALTQAEDPLAGAVWRDAIRALSLGLATLTVLLDPGAIVLGGGLAEAGALLLDPLREALASRLTWRSPPPLRASRLGLSAGRTGAAILAFRLAGQCACLETWDRGSSRGEPSGGA